MKYKVGQFLSRDDSVLLRISAIMDQGIPLYGVITVKHAEHLHWYTEHELDKYEVIRPDRKPFENLKVGDHVKVGDDYVQVLARIGDAALLSETPDSMAASLLHFGEVMQEQGGVVIMPPEAKAELKKRTSLKNAHMRADDWYDIEVMMLMNWKVVADS